MFESFKSAVDPMQTQRPIQQPDAMLPRPYEINQTAVEEQVGNLLRLDGGHWLLRKFREGKGR